jgi:3-deoxy-D-manno-octulosonic-acid transferase
VILYRFLISLAAPVLTVLFTWRWLRGSEDRASLTARLGRLPKLNCPAVWIHGASNGELASARPVIAALREAHPDHVFWITCNTQTARDMVVGWNIPNCVASLAPIDLLWIARRAIRNNQIVMLCVVESELWPNRMLAAARAKIPVVMLGARLSERSAKIWARFGSLGSQVTEGISLLSAQDDGSKNRFSILGVNENAIGEPFDIKSLYVAIGSKNPPFEWPRRDTILFASTHEGEDAILIEALKLAREKRTELKAIIAPRHPRRAPEIISILTREGLSFSQRSKGDLSPENIYLADTMGEMDMWYDAAGASFIGGSLVAKGGHTPFEPAAHGTVIVHGPHFDNFHNVYKALDSANAAFMANNPRAIAAALIHALDNPDLTEHAKNVTRTQASIAPLVRAISGLIP